MMNDAILILCASLGRITVLDKLARDARKIPEGSGNKFDRLKLVHADKYYEWGTAPEPCVAAAHAAMKRARMEIVSAAEIERDEKLARISAEIESIRAVLPGIAAKAAIALGDLARAIKSESENNQ